MSLARICRIALKSPLKPSLLRQDFRPLTRVHFRQESTVATKKSYYNESFMERVANKVPFFKMRKSKLSVTGYILYENIADKIDYMDFFTELKLPDTFYSWFVITELHVWMLSVRLMVEGEDGRIVRNGVISALWNDVQMRVKKLGPSSSSIVKLQLGELGEQMHDTLVFYDGGLHSEDPILAGALWRRFYQESDVELAHLELLVKYVRKQIRSLDHISDEQIFIGRTVDWEPFKQ